MHELGPAIFEHRYPGFVEGNRKLLRFWLRQPESRGRDQRVQATREKLRWAEKYRRYGIDPEMIDGLRGEDEAVQP